MIFDEAPTNIKAYHGSLNVEASLDRLQELLIPHFNSMADIQKKVFCMLSADEDFKFGNLNDMTTYVKIADEIGRYWQTSNNYQIFIKAITYLCDELYPVAVNGSPNMRVECANAGRLIAGVAILDGDYYLGLRMLKIVLELCPKDCYSYAAVLKWSCFLKEWEVFNSFYDDSRYESCREGSSLVRRAAYFYYVFHTLSSKEKLDILPDVMKFKNEIDAHKTERPSSFNYMAQHLIYSIIVSASNLEGYDINKYMEPGHALLAEESRALSLLRSRICFNDLSKPLLLFGFMTGCLPDGSDFFRDVIAFADLFETQLKFVYYLKGFGTTIEAESKLLGLYFNSLRLVNPYRVLVCLSEYYLFKSKTVGPERNCLKGFAASAVLLFSAYDNENERANIVSGNYKFEAPSDSSSILKSHVLNNQFFVRSHSNTCKCWSCLLIRSHGAYSVAYFWLQYLLNPNAAHYKRLQTYLKKSTTVSRARASLLKVYAPNKLKVEFKPFHVSYYSCLSTIKFLEDMKFKIDEDYEKLCDMIIQNSTEWLDLRFYWLLARQLKRSLTPPELDYFWLKPGGQFDLDDFIKMFEELKFEPSSEPKERFNPFEEYFQSSITMLNDHTVCKEVVPGARNPFSSKIEPVLKARSDFRGYGHLFFGEWRTRICEYLGAHLSECYPWYSAWYFIESRASSLRQSVRMHKLNASHMRFSDVDFFKDFVHTIPEDITVLQLVIDERNVLWLIRLDCDARPLVIPLRKLDLNNDELAKTLTELMLENDETLEIKNIDGPIFWQKRRRINARLRTLVYAFEESWIGSFRPLFIPTGRCDTEMKKHLNVICSHFVEHGFFKNDAKLLTRMTLHAEKSDFVYLLKVFGSLQQEKYKICNPDYQQRILVGVQKYLVPDEMLKKYNESEKYTLLMMSPVLHVYPWEFFPCYKRSPYILRMHSLHFLQRAMNSYGFPHIVNGKNTYYVINPGNDLPHTEERMTEALNLTSLQGMTRSAPKKKEIGELLSTKDVFLYIGHGSGTRYFGMSSIRDTKCRAAAILMGCSSVRLIHEGYGYDGHSPAFSYAIAGSPCVIGNLWMVTDGEIDKFFIAFMKYCFQDLVNSNLNCSNAVSVRVLMKALVKARDFCRLKYLTGAAVVAYGLPLQSQ